MTSLMAASRFIVVPAPSILRAVGVKWSSRKSVEFRNRWNTAWSFFDVSVHSEEKYIDEKGALELIDVPINIRTQ
jgi:hypothetical protein